MVFRITEHDLKVSPNISVRHTQSIRAAEMQMVYRDVGLHGPFTNGTSWILPQLLQCKAAVQCSHVFWIEVPCELFK